MLKGLIIFIFICLYAGVTFFGIGPVVFADGSTTERMITLGIVILVYAVLTLALRWILRRMK